MENQIIKLPTEVNELSAKVSVNKQAEELKKLKKELSEWKSKEVKERFERVDSVLHLVAIKELEYKIKKLKRGEGI